MQGLGGAVVSAIALSLIIDLFPEEGDRAKAMGVYGFVCAAGGSLGVLAGGLLTSALSWHWVFLVNLPIGVAVYALCRGLVSDHPGSIRGKIDVAGAVTITTALMLAVYAIVYGNQAGWRSGQTLGLLGAAAVLLAIFLVLEARIGNPLMPLGLFRLRNLSFSSVIGALWAASMFAWFFISALYMQLVLGYSPMQIGLAFLPSNLIMAAFSLGLSAKIVMRFGLRAPLGAGLALTALGLGLFAMAPVDGTFALNILPGMVLSGVGCGMALNPILLAAMKDVAPDQSGLASGAVNTAFMMGGALGLAVLASLAESQSAGAATPEALAAGYRAAFVAATVFAAVAAALCAFLRTETPATERRQAWASPSSTGN